MNPRLALTLLTLAALGAAPALADKADRSKPLTIEADLPSTLDLINQVVVFSGNATLSQGTMAIRAERVELRTRPDGHRSAAAIGAAGKPATFRQKRDGVEETIEGSADRIEYDSRGDVVRFIGAAQVRRLRGNVPADEVSGNVITYDNGNETFSVQGTAGQPGAASTPNAGRIRVVLTPAPEAAASAPK